MGIKEKFRRNSCLVEGEKGKGKKVLVGVTLSFLFSLSWGVVLLLLLLYILALFPCDAYPFDHPLCPFFRAANL